MGLLPFPLGKSIAPIAPFLYVPSRRRSLNGPKVLRELRWGRVTRRDESPHVPNRCPPDRRVPLGGCLRTYREDLVVCL